MSLLERPGPDYLTPDTGQRVQHVQNNTISTPDIASRLPDTKDLHVLTVLNPHSSNYKKAENSFNDLCASGVAGKSDRILTTADRHETAAILAEALKKGAYHAVLALTGDGGSNAIGQALHGSDDEDLQHTPVIFGAGGGACDLHAMTQGRLKEKGRSKQDYLKRLGGQIVRPLVPLEIDARQKKTGLERHETAFAYVSIGNLGNIAHALNGDAHRKSKLLGRGILHQVQEMMTAGKAVRFFEQFNLDDELIGRERRISDIVLTAGSRMGRRSIFPGDIFTKGYHETVAAHLPEVLAIAGLLAAGQSPVMAPREERTYRVRPRSGHSILLQYDGETFGLPLSRSDEPRQKGRGRRWHTLPEQDECEVRVVISQRPLYVAAGHTGDGAE